MALPRPWNINFTLSDEDALRGIELMTDFYNWQQRKQDPNWQDVTPQVYFRDRVLGWCQRERRLKDPALSGDPEVLRMRIDALGG